MVEDIGICNFGLWVALEEAATMDDGEAFSPLYVLAIRVEQRPSHDAV